MKKNIILAVTVAVICLNTVFAQESAKVNASVVRNFEAKFAGASNVKWESQQKGISLAQFRLEDESWLAYYSSEGDLIQSGRVIKSVDQLPIKIKESLKNAQNDYLAKYGQLKFSLIYEMTNGRGTEYYVPMESPKASMLISFSENGSATIQRKEKHASPASIDKSVIAKGN